MSDWGHANRSAGSLPSPATALAEELLTFLRGRAAAGGRGISLPGAGGEGPATPIEALAEAILSRWLDQLKTAEQAVAATFRRER